MTRRFPRLFAILLTILTPAVLIAQAGKDMGPAGQFYQQPKTKFKFQPGPKKTGGDVQVTVAKGGHVTEEKNEYAVIEGGVTVKYQDITLIADKLFYNLDTKLGTLFKASGSMEPSLYFTADKAEKIGDERYILTNSLFT